MFLKECEVQFFGIVIQALGESLSADATGETLSAGFVCEESHRIVGSFHHITRVIEDHDPTGSDRHCHRRAMTGRERQDHIVPNGYNPDLSES